MVKGYGSLILYTNNLDAMVEFYKKLGLDLELEEHEEGPKHFACDVGSLHFAIYGATQGEGRSVRRRKGGATQIGFIVNSVQNIFDKIMVLNPPVIWNPQEMPWGTAAMVEDPDGRAVEIYENNSS